LVPFYIIEYNKGMEANDNFVKSPFSKKFFPVTFIILIIIVAVLFFVFNSEEMQLNVSGEQIKGLEIAQKTALFLDKTIKPDGSFELLYECSKGLTCKPIESSGPPHTGQIILAYYDLWKKTDDPSYKEKAERAMNFVLTNCEKDTSHCEWNYFPLYGFYKDTGEARYKNAMLKVAGKFLRGSLIDTVNNNNGMKLLMLYDVTGEKKYLDFLINSADKVRKGEFDMGKVLYQSGDFSVKQGNFQAIWTIYLPAYNATKNPVYLEEIEKFFESARILDHTREFNNTNDFGNLIKVWEVTLDLTKIYKDNPEKYKIYRSQANRIGGYILRSRWDAPELKKFDGDFGFLHSLNKNKNNKSPFSSAWAARLYLRMSGTSFKLQSEK